jgi:hypothetical protein
MAVKALAIVMLLHAVAAAQPPTQEVLRLGNESASTGDWPRVSSLVGPLLRTQLAKPDLAEAYRLAGLAAYFQQRAAEADQYFFEYLKLDLDAQLDPSVYPPDVVAFFQNVKLKHRPELYQLRPKPKQYWWLNAVPPGGQIQNGERTKAIVVGGLLGTFAIANVTSFLVLRSWCVRVQGDNGQSATCDESKDHSSGASQLRALNILSGLGLIATYIYGVYDGVSGYRRRSREQQMQLYVAPSSGGGIAGIGGTF